jgi:hypothetical protein
LLSAEGQKVSRLVCVGFAVAIKCNSCSVAAALTQN